LRRSPIAREPFDDSGYLVELKYGCLRALACVRAGAAQLISRKRNLFMSFDPFCRDLTIVLAEGGAVLLDGETVVLDAEGRPQFYDVPPRRLSSRSTCSRASSVSG
jgi:ATP-dependent DNA ligase